MNEAQRGPHRATLLWQPADAAEFTAQASQPFIVLVDGARHEYRVVPAISLAYAGKIGRLRLDLPKLEPGIRYELEQRAN